MESLKKNSREVNGRRTVISPEDNGSIPLATAAGITFANPGTAFVSGVVGAGLFGGAGTGSGDYDFFRVEATAGQNITVDVDTPIDGLDSTVSISSIAGIELVFDDDDGETFDTLASFAVPATGTCYVVIYGFPGNIIADPFDSSSGTGFGSEAVYTAIIEVTTLEAGERDYYSFDLAAGDIIGAWTAFDADAVALSAVLAEWSSGRSYQNRIANLRGTGTGTRSNGNTFLKLSGSNATVFDDSDKDNLTGGSGRDWFFAISDRRIVSHENGFVTFLARVGKTTGGDDEVEPIRLRGAEFVRRWCLHILPKGYTKTRRFGGYWNGRREAYIAECRELLAAAGVESSAPPALVSR